MTDENKEEKQYGLVVPGKNRLTVPKPGNIFGEESGSDEDDGTDWVRKALRAEGEKNLVKKQTQLTMKRALKEDPTVYQYDEVYDDIERSKEKEKISKKTVEKKAKYIENLLKAADRRKREQEHRVERMVQKEREAEGAMFADKESFVTSAYRAKLEEFKKMEDEEKRMDRLESIGDVTKQQDISGIYRHLYHQTVDGDKKEEKPEKVEVKKEHNEGEVQKETENLDGDDPQTTDSEENEGGDSGGPALAKGTTKRQYRKRMAEESQSSSESESENKKTEAKSSKGETVVEKERVDKRRKLSSDGEKIETKKSRESKSEKSASKDEKGKKEDEEREAKPKVEEKSVKKAKKVEPEPPKINIWEKRTVGPVFEAALERYYARKAARSLG